MKLNPFAILLRPALLAGSLLLMPYQALAQPIAVSTSGAAVLELSMAAQPLGAALNQLAQQSQLTLLVDSRLLQGLQAPALQGPYTLRDALQQLLQGSGLEAEVVAQQILLRKIRHSQSASTLATLNVQGNQAGAFIDESLVEAADRPYLAAQSQVHLSSAQIQRHRGTSPADVFKAVTGVQVGDARNSHALDVNIRGLQGQNRVPVLVDGSLQSVSSYRGYAGMSDASYVDMDLISAVDIEKGPGLSAQGAGAVGGLVRLTSLKPEDVLLPGQTLGARLNLAKQSNSVGRPSQFHVTPRQGGRNVLESSGGNASLSLAGKFADWALLGAVSRRDLGNYFSGRNGREHYVQLRRETQTDYIDEQWVEVPVTVLDEGIAAFFHAGDEVLNTSQQTTSTLVKARWQPDAQQKLELSHRSTDSHFGQIMSSQIYRSTQAILPQWKDSKIDLNSFSLNYQLAPQALPWLQLTSNLWHTDLQSRVYNGDVFRNPRQGKPNVWDHECESCVDLLYLAPTQSQRSGADVSNQQQWQTAVGAVQWSYGWSWQREALAPADSVHYSLEDRQNNWLLREGHRVEQSLFTELKWAPTAAWSAQIGARYQRFQNVDHNERLAAQTRRYQLLELSRLQPDGTLLDLGWIHWLADEAGQFTAATDPRLNGLGIVESWVFPATPIANLQYDQSRIGGEGELPTGQYHAIPGQTRRDHGITPMLTLDWHPVGAWSLYYRHSQGLRMPSLMESTLGSSVSIQMVDVEPEHSKNHEIGLNFLADQQFGAERLRAKVALFQQKTVDYLTRRPLDRDLVPSTDIGQAIGNVDHYLQRGVELQGEAGWQQWQAQLGLTYYSKTELCDSATAQLLREKGDWMKAVPNCTPAGFSGMYVSNHVQPKVSASFSLSYSLWQQQLEFGQRTLYTGSASAKVDTKAKWMEYFGLAPMVLTKPVTVVDLFASYRPTAGLEINASVDNLFDRYYFDAQTLSLMPAPGRTVRLSLSQKF